MGKKELFIVGELNVDLLLNGLIGFPEVGKEIVANTSTLAMGSSSAIMAANSAALDVATAFCGIVGDDLYGNLILDRLQKSKVDIGFIKKTKDHGTGITIVMNYGQDRANVTYCGAMGVLAMPDIPWSELVQYKHLHISSVFLQKKLKENIVDVFKEAKIKGLTTSLDLQWDPNEEWDFDYMKCLPYVDVFLPNKQELLALTKASTIEEAIDIIKPISNCIALKLGEQGSIGIKDGERVNMPIFFNPEYVDSIGAGDSFNSGFIKKYLENAPLSECLRFGNLMGAVSTTVAGGTAAFVDKELINSKVNLILASTKAKKL